MVRRVGALQHATKPDAGPRAPVFYQGLLTYAKKVTVSVLCWYTNFPGLQRPKFFCALCLSAARCCSAAAAPAAVLASSSPPSSLLFASLLAHARGGGKPSMSRRALPFYSVSPSPASPRALFLFNCVSSRFARGPATSVHCVRLAPGPCVLPRTFNIR